MEWLITNSETFVYTFSFVLIIGAAYLILLMPSYGQGFSGLNYKFYVMKLKKSIYTSLNSNPTETLFKEAGYPLNLTGFRFSLLRYAVLLFLLLFPAGRFLIHGTPPALYYYFFVVGFWMCTSSSPHSLLSYSMRKLTSIKKKEKNRECFLLYSMLLNEFNINDGRPFNLYSILHKFSAYFDHIKPTIIKTLAAWKTNPDYALELFAMEIGTPEAKDLAGMLKAVDITSPDKAHDIINSRYEQFQTSRHEHHRRSMKNKDLIGYIIFFVPTLAILFNMVFVLGLAVQDLLVKLNNH